MADSDSNLEVFPNNSGKNSAAQDAERGTGVSGGERMEAEKPKRRSHKRGQRGSVLARSGGWTIVYRTPEGKQKWQGGFATRGSAQDALTDILKKIRDRKYVDAKPKLFEDFCKEWLEAKKTTLKPQTWANDRSMIERKLKPSLGKFE